MFVQFPFRNNCWTQLKLDLDNFRLCKLKKNFFKIRPFIINSVNIWLYNIHYHHYIIKKLHSVTFWTSITRAILKLLRHLLLHLWEEINQNIEAFTLTPLGRNKPLKFNPKVNHNTVFEITVQIFQRKL